MAGQTFPHPANIELVGGSALILRSRQNHPARMKNGRRSAYRICLTALEPLAKIEDGVAMKRKMSRQDDLEPGAALAAILLALSDAARYSGAGLRTVARRAAPAGSKPIRRPRTGSAESDRRAVVVRRMFRGDDRLARRTPADYLAAGVLAGTTATIALAVLSRSLLQRTRPGAQPVGDDADVPERGTVKERPPFSRSGRRRSSGGSRPLVMLSRIGEVSDEAPTSPPAGRSTAESTGAVEAGPEPAPSSGGSAGGRRR
jgi:hypothetical protein